MQQILNNYLCGHNQSEEGRKDQERVVIRELRNNVRKELV